MSLPWIVFRVGHCSHPEAMTRLGAPWRPAPFPFLATLIEHPREGPILFDTGYARRFLEETRTFPNRLYRMVTPVSFAPEQGLAVQLAARGLDPREVGHVFLSHFHADHVAGLADFPNARVHCATAAWSQARSLRGFAALRRALLPGLLPANLEDRIRLFEGAALRPLPQIHAPLTHGFDIFGDGETLAVPLPGHGAGHHGLTFPDANGRVFLVGDAAWSLEAIRRNAPPPRLTSALMGDTRTYRATLGRLHALGSRPGLLLVPCHCRESAHLAASHA